MDFLTVATLALSGLLAGYITGYLHCEAKAKAVLRDVQSHLTASLDKAQEDLRGLTAKLVGMQRAGFVAVPDEEGEVYAIDNSYELEVERRRNQARTTNINSLREG